MQREHGEKHGLADSGSDSGSDSEAEGSDIMFDPTQIYKEILGYLQPGETVSKALCRLGNYPKNALSSGDGRVSFKRGGVFLMVILFTGKGKKRLTNAERWKRKQEERAAEDEENSVSITKLTELANELLTRTGNMDIYQESFEHIKRKVINGTMNEKAEEGDFSKLRLS